MKYFDVLDGDEWVFTGTYKDIAEKFGLKYHYLKLCFSSGKPFRGRYRLLRAEMVGEIYKAKKEKPIVVKVYKGKKIRKKRKYKEYAVYKGEELLEIGTAKELAKKLNLSENTIWYLRTPSNRKRDKGNKKTVVSLEESDEE